MKKTEFYLNFIPIKPSTSHLKFTQRLPFRTLPLLCCTFGIFSLLFFCVCRLRLPTTFCSPFNTRQRDIDDNMIICNLIELMSTLIPFHCALFLYVDFSINSLLGRLHILSGCFFSEFEMLFGERGGNDMR